MQATDVASQAEIGRICSKPSLRGAPARSKLADTPPARYCAAKAQTRPSRSVPILSAIGGFADTATVARPPVGVAAVASPTQLDTDPSLYSRFRKKKTPACFTPGTGWSPAPR